jgi:cbb3-type cytochrome oxidase subunit 1
MGISGDFVLSSVHAHTALLGWATMGLAGLIYLAFPDCGHTRLAKLHFWGHNIGLPVMMVSLAFLSYGVSAAEKVVAASSSLVLASLAAFTVNVFRNARREG